MDTGIQGEVNILSRLGGLKALLLHDETQVVFLQDFSSGHTLQVGIEAFFDPFLADHLRLEGLQRLLLRSPHVSEDMGSQGPVGIPAHRTGGRVNSGNSWIPFRHARERGKVDLRRELERRVGPLVGVATQILHVIIHLDAQIPQRLDGGFLHNPVNVHLLLFASFFPHPHLHQGHGQPTAVGPGIVPGKFPHIEIDVVSGPVFRQRHAVAVQDQSAGRGQ